MICRERGLQMAEEVGMDLGGQGRLLSTKPSCTKVPTIYLTGKSRLDFCSISLKRILAGQDKHSIACCSSEKNRGRL